MTELDELSELLDDDDSDSVTLDSLVDSLELDSLLDSDLGLELDDE